MAFHSLAVLALTVLFAVLATCNALQAPLTMSSPTLSNLGAHIAASSSSPSTLNVTISNSHPSSPLTIITWDAPFERTARDSGSYHIQPAHGGDELKSLGLRIKRRLPAPRDALLEIPAGGKVERALELRSRWIPADGERYKIWARGPWRAVWAKSAEDVTDEDLGSLLGDFGVDAKFETNVLEMTLE